MVGMMDSSSSERLARLANSAQTAMYVPSKLDTLHKLKLDLSLDDPTMLSELLPRLFDLQSDRSSPVRKFVTQMLREIGVEQMDLLPDIVPVLLTVLLDGTPAVAHQAITSAISLFRSTLIKVTVQVDFIMESLSRHVNMEIPQVEGRISEVCVLDKASTI